jgi:signal peptidase I
MRRSIGAVSKVTVGLVCGSAVAFAVAYAALLVGGFKPVAVYSGSMRPTIPVGGLALDRPIPAADVRVGDVITFNDPYVKGRLVTHRVVQIVKAPNGLAYRTKGDANPSRDPWAIRLTGEVGRVSLSVPFAGYIVYYAHTREVRTVLILVFAVTLLISVLRRIWRKENVAPAGA